MIKKILVPTDGSVCATVGVTYAVELAKQHNASLTGLHVVDVRLLEGPFLRDISASLGTAPYVNYQNNISLILEERGKAALNDFRNRCEEAAVPFEEHQLVGSVAHTILEHGELTDLLIMGRGGEHSEWLDGLIGSTTEAVVRHAKCPVLVTERESAQIGQFIVAYDGSAHARKALQFSATISNAWRVPFKVLSVNKDGSEDILDEARSYLEAHEVEVEYIVKEGDPREVIVEMAGSDEADLIVMGAYGHSKVRELLLGSTTQYVMNHARCPLLLTR